MEETSRLLAAAESERGVQHRRQPWSAVVRQWKSDQRRIHTPGGKVRKVRLFWILWNKYEYGMYYGSWTVDRIASGQSVDACCISPSGRCVCTLQMAALFCVKWRNTSILKVWRQTKMCQSMHIYLKNIRDKFHKSFMTSQLSKRRGWLQWAIYLTKSVKPCPHWRLLSPVLATVAEFGNYSRQCGQGLRMRPLFRSQTLSHRPPLKQKSDCFHVLIWMYRSSVPCKFRLSVQELAWTYVKSERV